MRLFVFLLMLMTSNVFADKTILECDIKYTKDYWSDGIEFNPDPNPTGWERTQPFEFDIQDKLIIEIDYDKATGAGLAKFSGKDINLEVEKLPYVEERQLRAAGYKPRGDISWSDTHVTIDLGPILQEEEFEREMLNSNAISEAFVKISRITGEIESLHIKIQDGYVEKISSDPTRFGWKYNSYTKFSTAKWFCKPATKLF